MANYLITQATGGQSVWAITHLLAAGAKVHAVVRDLEKELPAVLKSPGVTLFQGESTNFTDIYKAAQGCSGVFLNTFMDPSVEALQANTIVKAAKKAGIEHVVTSTTVCTDNEALWSSDAAKAIMIEGYYASKHKVEEAVRGGGFRSWTILRPAVIHYDLFIPRVYFNFPRLPSHGEIDHVLDNGRRVPFTDVGDIGKFIATALLNPAKFGGQEIELTGELLSGEELRDIVNRVSGKNVKAVRRTPEELQAMDAAVFGTAFQLLSNMHDFAPLAAAIPAVQAKFGIPFTSFEAALERDKALLLETLANVE